MQCNQTKNEKCRAAISTKDISGKTMLRIIRAEHTYAVGDGADC